MSKPAHKHDCKRCRFLGSETIRGSVVDLYACKEGSPLAEAVARYSSDGPDYSAAPLAIIKEIAMQSESDHPYSRLYSRLKSEGSVK